MMAGVVAAVLMMSSCLLPVAAAANVYWDGGTADIGVDGDGASAGGAGTWDTTILNWDVGASPHVAWNNAANDTAVFGGTAGTVTLGTGITVGGVTVNTASYLITGNTITLASGTVLNSTAGTDNSNDPIISSILAGSDGLTKTGSGWLRLSAASSSLSGDVKIQTGTLYARHSALGTGGIVFTGDSTFSKIYNTDNNFPATMSVTVNPGVSATISGSTYFYNTYFAGLLAGDSTAVLILSMGGNTERQFNSTGNTFLGELYCKSGGTGDNGGRCVFRSLPDSAQKIRIDNSVFRLANGGVDMTFTNRPIEILSHARIDNDSTDANVEITVMQDLIATIGNNSRTLYLSGVNTGTNTFGGIIGNSGTGSGAVSVTKQESGKWILSAVNTYSGATTISDGTLELGGSGSLGSGSYSANIVNNGVLKVNTSANQTLSGVISGSGSIVKDNSGTLTLTGANTYSGNTTVSGGTLSLGDGTSSSNLSDDGDLIIESGAVVNLNYSGSDQVYRLYINGSLAAAGTWGATGSGASNIDDTYFTGSGVIYYPGGNEYYWDGGTVDIPGNGDASSTGSSGTWDTSIKNWDIGAEPHVAWGDTGFDRAILGGSANAAYTVTLSGAINIRELFFSTTGSAGARYTLDGGTLNFGAGGLIRISDNRYDQTITSIITGSPDVRTKDYGASNQYKGLKFTPTSGSQVLGDILNPDNSGTTDKAGVTLGGSTTGNTARSISYAGGDRYGTVYVTGGEWTVGALTNGTLTISGGTLIAASSVNLGYGGLTMSGGKLSGAATVFHNDRRMTFYINSGGTLAPGSNGVGTLTFDWGPAGSPSAGSDDYSLWMKSGSTYEWEIGDSTNDAVHLTEGRLYADTGMTLKVLDGGGEPTNGAQLAVFTYDGGVTRNLGTVTIDTSALGSGWVVDTPALTDDGAGIIYLTGVSKPNTGSVFLFK